MRLALPALLASLLFAAPAFAQQQTVRGVGLGAGIGIAAPFGKVKNFDGTLKTLSPNFDWGFYVDIPLAYGFHLTPHAELYNVSNNLTATDIGIAFKFIVEIPNIRPYFGLEVGDTNLVSTQQFKSAGLCGVYIKLIANLDCFVEARYIQVLRDSTIGGNVATVHGLAGLLLRF